MTENEVIKKLNMLDEALNFQRADADESSYALQIAIQALEEIQQYRAIGTIEEFKEIKQWKAEVMEGFCKYDASSFEEIVVNAKAKAIDELLENQLEVLEDFKEWEDGDGYPIHSMSETQRISKCKELIKQVAEQIKAGVENEN